nr:hypothetical protein [Draconibacterium orientale]
MRKLLFVFVLVVVGAFSVNAQLLGLRIAANSGMLISELGTSDVPHPDALLASPATSSEKFTPQLSAGLEAELLIQISEKTYFGVELDYTHLKGFNDDPPVFNYFLTPYFQQYQNEFIISPLEYNTRLFNVAVNYKYFFYARQGLDSLCKTYRSCGFGGYRIKVQRFFSRRIFSGC